VNALTTHSAWLFSSLVLGCNGLLSGSGSVIADLQARLFRAVQRNDLAGAKRLNDRIEPTARVFYADPFVDMHNRMKEALVLLGKLPRAVVRPPLARGFTCTFVDTRKDHATRQKSQIAAASRSHSSLQLQGPQNHRDETRFNERFILICTWSIILHDYGRRTKLGRSRSSRLQGLPTIATHATVFSGR
jgi:hypothetical protein